MRPIRAVLLLVGLVLARPADACSVCGCGDPLADAVDAQAIANTVHVSLGFQWLTASASSDENPAETEYLDQATLQGIGVYSPTNDLNLVVHVPFERKVWQLQGGDAPERVDSIGIGDVSLSARYFLWQHTDLHQRSRQHLGVFGGSTLPTGPVNAQLDGQRIDDHAQLGTGAFGPYLGVLYAYLLLPDAVHPRAS